MAKHREFWICPHQYSCGGYYVAERWPEGVSVHLNGEIYDDDMSFWLLTGRQVLNENQVQQLIGTCMTRGEEITIVRSESLPKGARWLNLR